MPAGSSAPPIVGLISLRRLCFHGLRLPCPPPQVVVVFLASFISGTLLNQIQQVVERPASLLTVLGAGAPQTASFFLLYAAFNALVVLPLRLLQPWGLLLYKASSGAGRSLARSLAVHIVQSGAGVQHYLDRQPACWQGPAAGCLRPGLLLVMHS